MIVATLAWEVKGEKGECRPTRRCTDRFQEEHWNKYEQILTERIQETQAKLRDKRPSDKLGELQKALTRVAAEAAGENKGKRDRTRVECGKHPYGAPLRPWRYERAARQR
eukprot:4742202-Pleurochrysis_carterae.AAC.1